MDPCYDNKRNQIQYQEHGHEIGSADRKPDTYVWGKEIPNHSALPMKAISTLYNVIRQEIQQEKQGRRDPYHSSDQFCVSNETRISKWMKNGEVTIHCNEDKCYDADSDWQDPHELNKLARDFSHYPWDPCNASVKKFHLQRQGGIQDRYSIDNTT